MNKLFYLVLFFFVTASCTTIAKDTGNQSHEKPLPFKVKLIPADIKKKILPGKNVLLLGIDENGEVFVFTENKSNLRKKPKKAATKTRIGKKGGTFFNFDITVVTASPNCYRIGGNPVVWWPFDSDCPHE